MRPKYIWHTPEERFWAKVNKDGPVSVHRPDLGSCWIWTACVRAGYGYFWDGQRYVSAHRFLIDVPPGLVPDHLCQVKRCVRPTHLEVVTSAENTRRACWNRGWLNPD